MEKKQKQSTENFIKDIRRKTRRLFSSVQKILIVMEALRGESSTAEICRNHGIHQAVFYKWNKEFMEAGKKRLNGDTTREATSDEVSELRKENQQLKVMLAEMMLQHYIVKKSRLGISYEHCRLGRGRIFIFTLLSHSKYIVLTCFSNGLTGF